MLNRGTRRTYLGALGADGRGERPGRSRAGQQHRWPGARRAPVGAGAAPLRDLTIWWLLGFLRPRRHIGGEMQKAFTEQHPGVTIDAIVEGSGDKLKTQARRDAAGLLPHPVLLADHLGRHRDQHPVGRLPQALQGDQAGGHLALKLKEVQHQGEDLGPALHHRQPGDLHQRRPLRPRRLRPQQAPETWDDFEKTIPA